MFDINSPSESGWVPHNPQEGRSNGGQAHGFWGVLFCIALILGLLVDVSREHVRFFGFEGPPCLVERVLGNHHLCPGFGLSRSTALALQGEFVTSWGLNPAGLGVALVIVGGVLLHLICGVRGYFSKRMLALRMLGRCFFLGAVLVPWCFRIVFW
jgi:hypothetical protein